MCSHYEAPTPGQLAAAFGIDNDQQGKLDLWPGYIGPFLRPLGSFDDESGERPGLEVLAGAFGLIPSWSKDTKLARRTFNARSQTVADKPSFRNAWREPSPASSQLLLFMSRIGGRGGQYQPVLHAQMAM